MPKSEWKPRPAEPYQPGNTAAVRHGAYSERQIAPRATNQKRRFLRQNGLRLADLNPLGRAMLTNWSRAAVALALMDEFAAADGWLDEEGNPRGFAKLYVSMLNSERLALRALEGHLRDRERDPVRALGAYLEANYSDDDEDEDDAATP